MVKVELTSRAKVQRWKMSGLFNEQQGNQRSWRGDSKEGKNRRRVQRSEEYGGRY